MNPYAQEFIPAAQREASSRSSWGEYPSPSYQIQHDSGLAGTSWQTRDAFNGVKEAGEVQVEGISRVGSRKLSFSQAEMNFDDVFASPRTSISPRGSRRSIVSVGIWFEGKKVGFCCVYEGPAGKGQELEKFMCFVLGRVVRCEALYIREMRDW